MLNKLATGDVFAQRVFKGVLGGLLFMVGIVDLVLGSLVLHYGLVQSNALCEVPLSYWATVYGSVLIVSGSTAIISGICIWFSVVATFAVFVVSFCAGVTALGLLIYMSVLAFSANRWNRVVVNPSAFSRDTVSPCDFTLYHPVASVVIAAWVLFGNTTLRFGIALALTLIQCIPGARLLLFKTA